jgi:hypothetical protein
MRGSSDSVGARMVSTSVLGISVCTAATFLSQLEQSVLAETYCSLADDRMEFSDSKVLGGVCPGKRLWLKYRGIPETSITWIGTHHPIGAPVACFASTRNPTTASPTADARLNPNVHQLSPSNPFPLFSVLQVFFFFSLSFPLHLLFSTL